MTQADQISTPTPNRYRMTALIILATGCMIASGCAPRSGLRSYWNEHFGAYKGLSNSKTTANGDWLRIYNQPKPAVNPIDESSMAANVAIQNDPAPEPEGGKTLLTPPRAKPKANRTGVKLNHVPVRSGEIASNNDTAAQSATSSAGSLTDVGRTDSSLDRLNAALSDDAIQAQALPEHSLTPLEARIRVDLLISRAKQLLDVGQLEESYRNAILAQQLGETSLLDFSPEEDRPIDLVRRIESLLEEKQQADQSADERLMADSETPEAEPAASEVPPKTAPESTADSNDKSRLARMRRDWSTLFKREKKAVAAEVEPGQMEQKSPKVAAGSNPVSSKVDVVEKPVINRSSRDGVVMANRSVTLGNPDPLETSVLSYTPPSRESEANLETEVNRPTRYGRALGLGVESEDDRDNHEAMLSEANRAPPDLDEGTASQTDFELSERERRSREFEAGPEEAPKIRFHEEDDDARKSDWNTSYVLFGICSLFAFICYRRGTT